MFHVLFFPLVHMRLKLAKYLIASSFQLVLHTVVSRDPMHIVPKVIGLVHMLVAWQNKLSHNLRPCTCHVVRFVNMLFACHLVCRMLILYPIPPLRGCNFDENLLFNMPPSSSPICIQHPPRGTCKCTPH